MDAINSFKFLGFDRSLPSVTRALKISIPCSQLFKPKLGVKCGGLTLQSSSLIAARSNWGSRISYRGNKGAGKFFRVPTVSCSLVDNGEDKEMEQEGVIDLKLPRRRLLVTFTCDACGTRSQRLINRLAYERGLVYVQCSGCSQYHKLVDNLGLVVEYNLQEEIDLDAKMDQI